MPPVPPAAVVRAAAWPAVVLGAYLLGWGLGGEAVRWPAINVALHFAGGLAVAHVAAALVAPLVQRLPRREAGLTLAAGCLALTTTAAVAWEFLECLVALVLGVAGPSGSPDTLVDIAVGMAGALAYAACLAARRPRPVRPV